jgi:hypothetical protein
VVNPQLHFDRLAATVEQLGVLRQVIALADQAPVLTDEQLRFRLLALAEHAVPRSNALHRSPADRWSSEARVS